MKTWAVLKAEIQSETNTESEEFFSASEYLAWCNDAIGEAEKEIVGLQDKYLETEGVLHLVAGQSEIALPADIYANKITGIFYSGGEGEFEVKPIKKKEQIYQCNEMDRYRYMILNKSTGRVIKIYPESRETSVDVLRIFYIRKSSAIVNDTDTIDIPIADGFIKQYIKDKMKEKENGPLGNTWPSAALERERSLLISALNNMIPDDNNDLEVDTSFYEEFDSYELNW